MIVPFGLLLMAIALAPLFFANYWHKHYPKVALLLAAIPLGFVSTWLAYAIYLVMALVWLVPDSRIEQKVMHPPEA